MNGYHPLCLRSLRKAPLRIRICLLLRDEGPLPAPQIADRLGVEERRVIWALHGRREIYRPEHALVRLEMVSVKGRGDNARYSLTREGAAALDEILPALRRWPVAAPQMPGK